MQGIEVKFVDVESAFGDDIAVENGEDKVGTGSGNNIASPSAQAVVR